MKNNLRVNINDVGGEIAKEDERYIVKDNTRLKDVVLSSTRLNPNCATNGHRHEGQEEVYIFQSGNGIMELDGVEHTFADGDIFLIEDNVFHKVTAGPDGAYFICVFNGARYDKVAVLGYN